jgi:putative glutamine amidotransferase
MGRVAAEKLRALPWLPAADGRALPQVGIVVSDAQKLLPTGDANLRRLLRTVTDLGCRPLLIGPQLDLALPPSLRASARVQLAASLDGLIGLGGPDVDPALYGEANRHAEGVDSELDSSEADLVRACFDAGIYMLGICRAHQLWNVAAGGSLVQDLLAEGLTRVSRRQRDFGVDVDQPHALRAANGRVLFENRIRVLAHSELAAELGAPTLVVNAAHHQAVRRAGAGFRVTARASALEGEHPFIAATERWNGVTIQFHPEARREGAPERRLLELLGRRAHVAHLHRSTRQERRSIRSLKSEMLRTPVRFRASDFQWAEELTRRLA